MLLRFIQAEFDQPVLISHSEVSVVGPRLEYLDGSTPTRDGTTQIILKNQSSYIVRESPEVVQDMVNNAFNKGIIV